MRENQPLLLAIDQGTTSSRAILFSAEGEVCAVEQKELPLHYPQDGWVEQCPEAIWQQTLATCRAVFQAQPERLQATRGVGITNQRETTIVWDRKSGEPIYNAIVWQDRRTAEQCAALRQRGAEAQVQEKTGLLLDPYFSATKIAWILDHVDGARRRAEAGELAFGTVDCFLLWRLTEGRVHATDASNAARTSLFNLADQCWDPELLALFDIPTALLPEVRDNTADFGESASVLLGRSLPIAAMIGDQQAALVGQCCFSQGEVKSTYGTGCFLLMNAGGGIPRSQNRLLSTVAYRLSGRPCFAIEGAIFIAGAAIQWLRDGLQLFSEAGESEALAMAVADNGGVYFVPALTGLGAPHWRPDLRGAIVGLARDSSSSHIARAALEAQAYQSRDLLTAMAADTGRQPAMIRADGGLVANQFVCQFLADITRAQIDVPASAEATAWGAASLAGLQLGIYADLSELAALHRPQRQFSPAMESAQAEALYRGWQRALQGLLDSP